MTTPTLAAFVARASVPPEVSAVAGACCARLPVTDPRHDPDGFWVVCVLLRHGGDRVALTVAAAVGMEVALRVHASLDGHLTEGWDPACPAVTLGVAAAVARLDGLDAAATARALAIAATQAGGLTEAVGTPLGDFQRRRAAENGRQAVDLARAGMTTPDAPLEGRRGLYPVMAPTADPGALVDGLGRRWLLAGRSTLNREHSWDGATEYARAVLP
ncbi:MmgE/PrpD family protein [Plantactinospora sp. GCM10030261]|uniref:MmgE/PrpD family protein n=1 Tax=Plantactinospora sp. GCM10030261 TaxID=3273420 RepID=UPI00361B0354